MRSSPRSSSVAFLAALVLVSLGGPAAAQRVQPGSPASLQPGSVLPEPPTEVLPRPDIEALMREDDARANWPYRFGAEIATSFSCDDSGVWDVTPSGELVWRLRLRSPGARSLSVLFSEYELPETGRVFVFDPRQVTVLGAFTRETRQPNGMLAVQPLAGDDLVIEYVQDALDPGSPRLVVGTVVHDYRGILDVLAGGSTALASCLVDINCPAGAPYQSQKRAVIMVIMGGGLCSAGVLNNSAQDGTPYFLTANHCGNMANVVAVFEYENTGCGTGGASQSKTISGATLLAASSIYDCQLYRLSSTPPQNYHPFFAGWDRTLNQPGMTISISHPSGGPKKLARDNDSPIESATRYTVDWELGVIQPGSSGSPLFNNELRVIGPACCVSTFACSNQWALYGNFGNFFQAHSLGQWLDPLATGASGIDGFDPFQGQAIPYNGSGVNPVVYTSVTNPTLGTTWVARIDTSIVAPPSSTRITGYLAPSAGTFLPTGELLVDPTSPRIFVSFAPSVNFVSTHSNPIPNSPSMVGVVVYTQGTILMNGPVAQTNGIALHLR